MPPCAAARQLQLATVVNSIIRQRNVTLEKKNLYLLVQNSTDSSRYFDLDFFWRGYLARNALPS
jgi:hypothetical protein